MQHDFLHGSYSSENPVKFDVPQGSAQGPIVFSLLASDHPLQVKNMHVNCDMLADDTTPHTSELSELGEPNITGRSRGRATGELGY